MRKIFIFLTFFTIILVFSSLSFFFGLNITGKLSGLVYENKIRISDLICYGHNKLFETYQMDCYWPTPDKQFSYVNNLKCREITAHSLNTDTIRKHNSTTTIKIRELNFSLNIDSNKKVLKRSPFPGEYPRGNYEIINEDKNMITATRKSSTALAISEISIYEYIIFSKKSGKGILSNTDIDSNPNNASSSMSVNYFECQ